MSPEQASGRRGAIDRRTDIYSLGVTLYELLTLTPVLTGGDRQELLRQLDETAPTRLRKIDASIPRDLETIVLTAISKEPNNRYSQAVDLADDLRRFTEHQPIKARRVSRTRVIGRWARRNPLIAGLTVLVATLLLLLSFGGPWVAIKQAKMADEVRAASETVRRQNYVLGMAAAYRAWDRGDLKRVSQLLQAQIPTDGQTHLRSFAYYHLEGRCKRVSRLPTLPHKGLINDLAYSPDGKVLATAYRDGTIRLWDARRRVLTHMSKLGRRLPMFSSTIPCMTGLYTKPRGSWPVTTTKTPSSTSETWTH